jgi:plastocyanin
MPRPLLLVAVVVIALATAACATASPGWTYAPPTPSPTPGPSVETSPTPATPSAAPSSEAPSGGDGGSVLRISAQNIAFDTAELAAPADAPFQIEFANNDAGVPHNVEIRDQSGMTMFKGEIFNGVATRTYDVPALPAGTYTFICTVHPNMTGTLTVS